MTAERRCTGSWPMLPQKRSRSLQSSRYARAPISCASGARSAMHWPRMVSQPRSMLSSSDYSTDNCFRLRRAELTHNVRYRAALLGPALAFGYPAYHNLADQKQLLALLNADEIGFTLS